MESYTPGITPELREDLDLDAEPLPTPDPSRIPPTQVLTALLDAAMAALALQNRTVSP